MFTSKKIAAAATAGILGSFALIGLGAAQASAGDGNGSNACVDDGSNTIRCEQTQSCTGGGQVDCSSTVTLGGKKSSDRSAGVPMITSATASQTQPA
ncbi:hypothetical protein ABTY20_17950 [Streptomyces sp. NPDC126497]|uniref:hypothetical protein n=1 Tax=Streptomyces sp. NPDC126497 TaxID=3155313 RepID=UPI0033297477